MRRTFCRLSLLVDLETHRLSPQSTVAVLTFDAPATRNAMTVALGESFKATMETLTQRDDVRCVVLTGKGAAFSAGGDASFLSDRTRDTYEGNIRAMRNFYGYFLSLRSLEAPVVAAINGHAIGAGMCVTLACDVRIVNKDAKVAVNFTRLGIHPGMGATYFLPKLIGTSRASRLLLSGEMISGSEACSLGIASEAVAEADVLPRALALARDIAKNTSRIAVKELVQTLRQDDPTALDAALAREAAAQAECYAEGKDLTEALLAMKEKRPPVFQ